MSLLTIPAEVYHADKVADQPSLSASIAKIFVQESPLHAWTAHPRLNPDYQPDEDEKFDVGRVAHALLLEGIDHIAEIDPTQYPAKNGNIPDGWTNKAIRAARDEARASGLIPVLRRDADMIRAMVAAARRAIAECEDLAGYRLEDGFAERTVTWTEDASAIGLLPVVYCKSRLDWIAADRRLILDCKFTDTSVNPEQFARQITRMGYDLQGSFYLRGNAATGGPEDAKFVFMATETKPPFDTSFVGLSPSMSLLGKMKCDYAIGAWRTSMRTGIWPGHSKRIAWAEALAYELEHWGIEP